MKTSIEGINLIKHFEGLHDGNLRKIGLQPKKCPAGIWTEGYGHAMRDSKGKFLKGANIPIGTVKNESEAVKLLMNDLITFENIVKRNVKVGMTQSQFDAVTSHAFNTGGSETMFRLINEKAPRQVLENWFTQRYISADGVILNGLIKRRKAEANLYFK